MNKSELNRTKSHGTPIKMLMAQEMSKEVDSKKKRPSVVAKLMGLDTIPLEQPYMANQRTHSRGSSRSQSCVSFGSWQEEHAVNQYQEQNDYKDIYEIRQAHNKYARDTSPQKEEMDGRSIEKKMALVRQNFIELKRLSTDEKLRQSKEFHDALEVLSSNKDSFLKFLQEPNSMFSQQLSDVKQSMPMPSEAKHITILRPAKIADGNTCGGLGRKIEKQVDKISHLSRASSLDNSSPMFSPITPCKLEDSQVQATRIVVLKPSPGKSHEIKAVDSPFSSLSKKLYVEDTYAEFGENDALESRELGNDITWKMRENLSRRNRDETLLSFVFSNGYTGDESSFNKSEIEFAAQNLSDLEDVSSASRHCWDYIDRRGSPYSLSNFSCSSYSPESSVGREAKKRLSERWAMMASNGTQEQKHLIRNSSTLGEMLALNDMKKSVIPEGTCNKNEQGSGQSTLRVTNDLNYGNACDTSDINIMRSKSLHVSSMASIGGPDSEVSDPKMEKTDITKDPTKTKSVKLSLKERVSSLFSSRTNKSSKPESRISGDDAELPGHSFKNNVDIGCEAGEKSELLESPNKANSLHSFIEENNKRMVHTKGECSTTKPCHSGNPFKNHEQPSPISVLEPPFQEDDHREPEFAGNFSLVKNGVHLPEHHLKSNQIDKSPPIGSIARTIEWNDSCTENVCAYPLKSSDVPLGAEEERQELFFLVQKLLAVAKLGNDLKSETFLASWHSLESPLDPSLRDNYGDLADKETLHEAKLRQRRSIQKLVFDCVNAALVELAVYGSESWNSGAHDMLHCQGPIVDCVWTQMEWFSGALSCVVCEGEDYDSLVVEGLVRKEVVGKGWVDHSISEEDIFRKEIEDKLLEELVQEAVEQFTGTDFVRNALEEIYMERDTCKGLILGAAAVKFHAKGCDQVSTDLVSWMIKLCMGKVVQQNITI